MTCERMENKLTSITPAFHNIVGHEVLVPIVAAFATFSIVVVVECRRTAIKWMGLESLEWMLATGFAP